MRRLNLIFGVSGTLAIFVFCIAIEVNAEAGLKQMEWLDRGLVALPMADGKVYLGWRWLGTESDDTAYRVYRKDFRGEELLTPTPLTDSTNLIDEGVQGTATYTVVPIIEGEAGERAQVIVNADQPFPGYLSVPLQTPEGYQPNDGSVGDLDGDGRYEIVLMQVGRSLDNSQSGETDPPILQAYTLQGDKLWEINLGINIRSGAHYTQFQVYDYDGDGRAELICKTADGTTDGTGQIIGNKRADHRNDSGYVLEGPEYLTVFEGTTGKAIDTIRYWPQRLPGKDDPTGDEMKEFWGDGYGNRLDRFLAGTAYLDGKLPSAVFSRGYYTRTYIAAYDFRDNRLKRRWRFDSEDSRSVGLNPRAGDGRDYRHPFSGQGNHSLSVADIDADGRDEIIFGAMVVDDDGRGLFSTGHGHGDALHVGDLDPERPGLEVFNIQERFDDAGAYMYAGEDGQILWKKPSVKAADRGGDKGEGPGRGVSFNVDPRYPGSESWVAGAGMSGVWDAKGNVIGETKPSSVNFAVYWDGDLLRELLNRNHISKWNWEKQETVRLMTAEGCRSNNGTKATPTVSADLIGDWREEVVLPTENGSELRIFTTTIPTSHRLRTLMHDSQYRVAVAWQNTAYNQPPHPSFYIDPKMIPPPAPDIDLAGEYTRRPSQ